MEDLFKKEHTCRLCTKTFPSMSVKRSKQAAVSTDSDFCIRYKYETPYFYHVYLCPHCGYAFLEFFTKQPGENLQAKLSPLPDFFSGQRDAATAELAYKRAAECAKMQGEGDDVLASLYLQMAWINRLKGEEEKEKTNLSLALTHYIDVYEKSNLADASKVMFLIGELNRRLGNPKEAVFWFSRVVNDDNSSRAMRLRAREAWQALRL